MPTLPTLTISNQAIWDRVFAAFHGDPAEYKTWLTKVLRAEVERREIAVITSQAEIDVFTKTSDVRSTLGNLDQ
jgi:hypothetical protein